MLKTEIEKKVKDIIASDFVSYQEGDAFLALPLDTKLVGYLDSLDMVELVMAIEEEFALEIADADAAGFNTIGDIVNYLAARPIVKSLNR